MTPRGRELAVVLMLGSLDVCRFFLHHKVQHNTLEFNGVKTKHPKIPSGAASF